MDQEEMEKNSRLETSVSLGNGSTRVKIGHYGAYGTAARMVYSCLLNASRGELKSPSGIAISSAATFLERQSHDGFMSTAG